ncbi:MAG: DUF348 domain-containing protein [Chloroflexi bacterium]|nr:DUF348 domain-containing protein [Chloroflexota bacterium]
MTKSPLRYLVILLLILGLGSFAAAGWLLTRPSYTIFDGRTPSTISGQFSAVQELLAAANIETRPEDVIVPAPDTAVSPDTPIQINRARQVSVRTASGTSSYWTNQSTLGAFLAKAGIPVQRADQIYADGILVPYEQLDDTAVPESVEIGQFRTITIEDDGQSQTLSTAAQTVGAVLQEAGITLFAADSVTPPLGAWLEPGMVIRVERSFPVSIEVDGRIIQTRTSSPNVLDTLAAADIGLVGYDYTVPGPEVVLQPGDTIQVIRVTEDYEFADEPIPYQTVYQANDQIEIDNRAIVSPGIPGIKRQRVRVRYENGVAVSREVDSEWVAQPPQNELIGYGTKIVIRTLDTPEGPLEYWRVVRMRITSYKPASAGKPFDAPGYGITASGLRAEKGVVAVDRSVVPWKSWVYVPNYGKAIAGDVGGGVRGRWIDLAYSDDDYVGWSTYGDVYYLTPVPPPDKINYLIPTVLP